MRNLYVVYDIGDDSTRSNLANILMGYGMHRVQYSVFSGILPIKDKGEMVKKVRGIDIQENDKIHIIDICEKCFRNIIVIGKEAESLEHLVL